MNILIHIYTFNSDEQHNHVRMKNWTFNLFMPHKQYSKVFFLVATGSYINQVLTPPVCKFLNFFI